MEEDIESSSPSMVPLALALLAIVLGGAGLYFGLNASQRLAPLTETVDEGTSSAVRLDKQLASIETRLAEVSAENADLKKTVERLRTYGSLSEQTAKQAASGVKSNREELVKLAEKMNELASSGVRSASPTASPSITASSRDSAASASASALAPTPVTPASASIYKIQSGDTFAKIASQKGVSLNALLDANPDADPRRLRIGQEINIPAN